MKLILFNTGALFCFSFILHIFIFSIIQLGILGQNLKISLNNIFNKYLYLIPILSFIIYILLKIYLTLHVIFLDSPDVTVTATLDDANFVMSGDVLKIIFENMGGAAVFSASARIAAGLISKNPMGVLPKIGIIGGTSAGFTILYRMSMESMGSNITNSSASISIKPIKIKLETVTNTNFDINSVNSLINSLGLQNTFQSNLFSFTESFHSNSILLQGNNQPSNSKVLSALDQQYPNWKDSFINSPLEENIIPHIINVLSNNLHLHFIILYLLIMLLIIITCKYILKDNIEFTKIQNNPLGA